jgi:hypothetical protein
LIAKVRAGPTLIKGSARGLMHMLATMAAVSFVLAVLVGLV